MTYVAVHAITECLDRCTFLLKVNGFDNFVTEFKSKCKDWKMVVVVNIDMEEDQHTISCWEKGLLVNISNTKWK